MRVGSVEVTPEQIREFCKKWQVAEFSIFGSALREDFRPDSDVDVLISLEAGEKMTLEGFLEMREELSSMFGGREIDLVEKWLVKNPYRRYEILKTREVLYAGG